MKSILTLFTILSIVCAVPVNAQTHVDTIEGEYVFFSVAILTEHSHPIYAEGVCKVFNIDDLQKDNLSGFLNDLYRDSYYVPDLMDVYPVLLQKYFPDKANPEAMKFVYKFYGKQKRLATKSNLILDSGENIAIQLFKIEGTFIEIDKSDSIIEPNTIRIDINDVPAIERCYIPINITKYSRYRE